MAGADRRREAAVTGWSGVWLLMVVLVLGDRGTMAAAPRVAAAARDLRLAEFQKENWQVEQGLPENNVRMVAQQPNGMLLVATSAGLASFDGLHFEAFRGRAAAELQHEAVNAVVYGRSGDLWIGTDGQGVMHQTADGVEVIAGAGGRSDERVRMLYLQSRGEEQGVLWVATQYGVERMDGGRMEAVAGGGMIAGDLTAPFAEDGGGGMFYVTSSGLWHWRGGVQASAVALPGPVGAPTALYRDPAGQVWVGSATGVWPLTAPAAGSRRTEWAVEAGNGGVGAGRLGSEVSAMLADPDGSLWIGTRHNGLWRRSRSGLEHWDAGDGLPENSIRTLCLDDERNLWIGMLESGLSRWRKAALAPFGAGEAGSLGYAATPFSDSRGDLWLGSWGKGLFRRHGEVLESMPMPQAPAAGAIRAIAEDRSHQIWVGTWYHGVYRWDGRRFTRYLLGTESPGNAVSTLLADSAGALWVGTYDGVLRYRDGVPARMDDELKTEHLLRGRLVTATLEDADGTVLVGTSTGLFRVRSETGRPSVARAVGGLRDRYVVSLSADSQGGVWAGTRAGGLAAVDGDEARPLPRDSGVPDLPVNTMVEDQGGRLWLGTSRGIARLSVADLHRVSAGQQARLAVVLLDRADGMRSSECSGSSRPLSTRMPDGSLWFATAKGFVHTTEEAAAAGEAMPTAEIRGWALSNDASEADLTTGPRLVLRAGEPDVLIFFWAKLLANPAQIEFRYRLAGYDRDWTPTRARVARYRRLPPGRYRFEVQARNAGGTWATAVAAMELQQRPQFYQTWWFLLLALVLLSVAAWAYVRQRIRRAKGSMGIVLEERNRIAQECHDTLMAGFSAVSWQLEATGKLLKDAGTTPERATESFELARSMVALCQAEARRIIWDLRDTQEVTNSLSRALERMLDVNHVAEHAKTGLAILGEEVALPPGCVHHLTCIGQEAVANALRHGAPTRVEVTVRYDSEELLLRVQDDGCGFSGGESSTSRRGHFGIAVMEERARKVGGTFRLQSHVGEGTEVTVSVPFDAMEMPVERPEQDVLRWIGI